MSNPEVSEQAIRNLTAQVQQLELLLLSHRTRMQECAQRLAMFENAAGERLRVIEHGDTLLKQQQGTIDQLRAEADAALGRAGALEKELAEAVRRQAEERERLEAARLETGRGVMELAVRERQLTAEILELRNEGLIHSIIRRISGIFS
ncbi:MAG: hypothetical protein JNM66_26000 [Bryobacterales bacterium]|nr:hypothetical protein [Bryobacterales bacterium]